MRTAHNNLVELLRQPGARPVFVTGAGISIASGIPPFRGTPDAVWERDVLAKGTVRYFHQKPVKSWEWFLKVFEKARDAQPNPGHQALVDIETWLGADRCLTVTQNVDGLHTKAGTKNLVEVHGTVRHMRCTKSVCRYGPPTGMVPWDEAQIARFQANPHQDTLPRCSCGALLRMHVLWFDESYESHKSYGLDPVFEALGNMTVLVFIGTSFAVTITDIMMRAGYERAVPMFVIDPNAKNKVPEMRYITEPSETYLPKLAAALRGGG